MNNARTFYNGIEAARPEPRTVALPYIENLLDVNGTLITVERRLSGEPVWRPDGSSPDRSTADIDAIIEAPATLAAIPGTHRVARFESALTVAQPDLHDIASGTIAALQALVPAAPTLVHGDLIAGNVLVSGAHAAAVLDFGFLSTAGDPAFDTAITASIYNMWKPQARDMEVQLDGALTATSGHDRHRLMIYQAAYALITACCLAPTCRRGTFPGTSTC